VAFLFFGELQAADAVAERKNIYVTKPFGSHHPLTIHQDWVCIEDLLVWRLARLDGLAHLTIEVNAGQDAF
jgi:hypothetical protein